MSALATSLNEFNPNMIQVRHRDVAGYLVRMDAGFACHEKVGVARTTPVSG